MLIHFSGLLTFLPTSLPSASGPPLLFSHLEENYIRLPHIRNKADLNEFNPLLETWGVVLYREEPRQRVPPWLCEDSGDVLTSVLQPSWEEKRLGAPWRP